MGQGDTIAVIISLVALGIGVLSWRESQKARLLTQAGTRASLHIANVTMTRLWKGGAELRLTITNVGSALASDVKLKYGRMYLLDQNSQSKTEFDTMMAEMRKAGTTDDLTDIPPHTSLSDTILITLPQELKKDWPTLIGLFFTLRFKDEASRQTFTSSISYTGLVFGDRIGTPELFAGTLPPPSVYEEER